MRANRDTSNDRKRGGNTGKYDRHENCDCIQTEGETCTPGVRCLALAEQRLVRNLGHRMRVSEKGESEGRAWSRASRHGWQLRG